MNFLPNHSNRQLRQIIYVQLRIISAFHNAAKRAVQMTIDEYEERIAEIVEDTNRFLDEQEAKVNRIMSERDANWAENLETVWQEKEAYREKWEKARLRRKEAKRWQREER